MINKIKIGYREYNVVYDEGLNTPDKNGDTFYGEIDYTEEKIKLNPKYKDKKYEQMETFIHEVLHGIFKAYGYEQYRTDENLINAISCGLTNVIKDNNIELKFNNDIEANIEIDYSEWKDKWVWCWDNDKSKRTKHKFDSYSPNHNKDYPFLTYNNESLLFAWKNVELVEDEK